MFLDFYFILQERLLLSRSLFSHTKDFVHTKRNALWKLNDKTQSYFLHNWLVRQMRSNFFVFIDLYFTTRA